MATGSAPLAADQTLSRRKQFAQQLAAPLRAFIATESGSAGILLLATIAALIWANSPVSDSYEDLWTTGLSVRLGDNAITEDLRHWVNDGLMVFFFFVIGLELKRELALGELTDRTRLRLPALAALAGIALPAAIYLTFNPSGDAAQGWGVAISTDTAFVLGVLALVGSGWPTQLRVFLLTLSIVDDAVALLIIAFFYSDDVSIPPLLLAAACVVAIATLGRRRIWLGPVYFALGAVLWVAMLESGVHPAIAGVLIAFSTAVYPPSREEVEQAAKLTRAFRQSPVPSLARSAKLSVERAVSPNERLQELLHPWTSYVIVPLFALANAGVALDPDTLRDALGSPVTQGVIVGLVVGKLAGIGVTTLAGARLRLGDLPRGVGPMEILGGAALCGIGFTVSLFIVDLAFTSPELRDEAKIGVLMAAAIAVVLGWAIFRLAALRARAAGREPGPPRLNPPVDPERDWIRGPLDAPYTLVEFADFECPFCGRATGVVEGLRARFGDQLRYVIRHLPLTDVHPHSQMAAEAAEAAGAQGRFWEMHDKLFAHQDALTPEDLMSYAEAIGLDMERFGRELEEGVHAQRVRDDVASAEVSGAVGTPTWFVGDRLHVGPYDVRTLADELVQSASRPRPRIEPSPREA